MPNPVQPRYANLAELQAEPLAANNSGFLKNQLNKYLFDHFGIDLDKNGKAPVRDLIVPRMMVMGKNDKGNDWPLNINDTNYKPGTPEFFEQVRLGNVFVYPAGESKPVQLQLEQDENFPGRYILGHSDPVEPENIPEPPVKPLKWWQKALRVVSFGFAYRKKARAYNQAMEDHRNVKTKLRDNAEGRKSVLEKERRDFEVEKRHREVGKDLATAKKHVDLPQTGKDNFVSLFKPVPDKKSELLKLSESQGLGMNYAPYTEEHFRDMTILTDDEAGVRKKLTDRDKQLEQDYQKKIRQKGLPKEQEEELLKKQSPDVIANGKPYKFAPFNQKNIKLGGTSLTDAQFAAVALSACYTLKNMTENSKLQPGYDPKRSKVIENLGYPKAEADYLAVCLDRTMGTADLFIEKPRDNGGSLYEKYCNPAREDAAEAFRQYQQGKPDQLAELLANGVNTFAEELKVLRGSEYGDQQRGAVLMGEELLNLLEQEPKLKELALKKGMDPEKQKLLEGSVKIFKMEQAGKQAEHALLQARYDGTELSKEQKAEYAKKLVMAKLATGMLRLHGAHLAADRNTEANKFANSGNAIMPPVEKQPNGTERMVPGPDRPLPPPGKYYVDASDKIQGALEMRYNPLPKFPKQITEPKGMADFEKLAEKIVADQKLADLSGAELYKKLNHTNGTLNLSDNISKIAEMQKNALQKNGPKKEGPQNEEPGLQQDPVPAQPRPAPQKQENVPGPSVSPI